MEVTNSIVFKTIDYILSTGSDTIHDLCPEKLTLQREN